MRKFYVTGMTCAACQARVEKAVSAVPGVSSCAVSLLTNSMSVEGDAPDGAIIKAVTDAGYGASSSSSGAKSEADQLTDTETPKMKRRLIWSLVFWAILMYFSMGHMMLGLPVPAFMEGDHLSMGLLQLLLTVVIMVINQRFFVSGAKSLWHRSPNMDALVAIGSGAAFVYSVAALFLMAHAQFLGDGEAVMRYMDEFYFESAATILTLITVGKTLEARSKGKTTDALKGLMKLKPKTARVLRSGVETEVPISEVSVGDIFVIRPGEQVPADGRVVKGVSSTDESALTGESIPADKEEGSRVYAGTVNLSGYLECEALKVGEDTALSEIIKMVSDAAATKAPIAKIADRVSGVFVPAVMGIALLTLAIWLILGRGLGFSLARAISVLVISCPCALGLATPVAIMVGSGVGAKNGILFKTAESLELTGKTEIAVLDKTGTVTEGRPKFNASYAAEGVSEEELLSAAYSLEKLSEHPLSRAITEYCADKFAPREVTGFEALAGSGLRGILDGKEALAGSLKFISGEVEISPEDREKAASVSEKGQTPLLFAHGGRYLGMAAVSDSIKKDSKEAAAELKNMGVRVIMLSGDNEKTAKAIAAEAGIEEIYAGVMPDGKAKKIAELKREGRAAMVGDGINDAPALTAADIGIAIGAGTDVAIDAADVVLMHSTLRDSAAAIRLSRAAIRIIRQNLFWAFCYNVIGIPIAAGALIPLGITLNPMIAAAAMSLSSFCVVSNALRLNLINVHDPKRDRKIKQVKRIKEENIMSKTLKIEGMMCPHCEMTVKNALEAVSGVASAEVSHTAAQAVVTLTSDVADSALKEAVEAKGYKVLSVE